MATRATRRTGVTLRFVREDLELGIPPVEVDLPHWTIRSSPRRAALSRRRRGKSVLAMEHPLVCRLGRGRWAE